MIELRILGTVDLRRDDGGSIRSVVVQPKRMALLAYLAAATPRGPHRRDTLLGLLWPELDADRGRAALSKALHHLRSSLGSEALVSRGEEAVELDRSRVWSDVAAFDDALEAGELDEALGLYGGDLLHGFFLSDAPEFERWLDGERVRLRTRAAGAAGVLAERARQAGELPAAATRARRALELSPGEEPALRRLMELLDEAGDRAGALRSYDGFAAWLREELEVEPAPETAELAERIRAREASRAPRPTGSVSSVSPDRDRSGPPLEVGPVRTETGPPLPGPIRPPAQAPQRVPGAVIALAAGAALVLLAGLVAPLFRAARAPAPTPLEPRRVLVMPFENRTLDPALDPVGRMTADWITDGVSRTGMFEVVPSSAAWAVEQASTATNLPASSREPAVAPPPPDPRLLARETGAGIVVSGSFYLEGGRLHFQAATLDAASGRVLRPVDAVDVPPDSTVQGIDRLRSRVLAALALQADTVYHVRAAATPPTYEAYRAYVAGMEAFVARRDPATALRHYEEAARDDTTWAMPRIASAIMLNNLSRPEGADSVLAPLVARRERLAPLEVGTLDMVLGMLRGDHASAYVAMRSAARIAPGTINEFMVGELARKMNRPSEAVAVLEGMGAERGELRGWIPYWRELSWSLHMMGEHEREWAATRRARELYPHDPSVLELEVTALAALGRVDELRMRMDERVASTSTDPPSAGALMTLAAAELEAHGHQDAATALRERGIAWFESRRPEVRDTPGHRLRFALILENHGELEGAGALLEELLAANPGHPLVAARLGGVRARQGDREAALALDGVARAYTEPIGLTGPINRFRGEHTVARAVIAAWLGDLREAVDLLRQAQGEGLQFGPWLHAWLESTPLGDDPGYREWIRPR